MAIEQPILGDDTLAGRPAFQQALADMSDSKFYRDLKTGLIPEPDGWVGGRAVWRIATIKRTVSHYLAAEKPKTSSIPRPGRPRTNLAEGASQGGAQ